MNSESFLQNIFLFQNLTDEQAQLIRSLLKEQTYHQNERIVEEGKVGESLFVIVSGKVRVTRNFDQESFVLTELGPYDRCISRGPLGTIFSAKCL